MGILGPWAFSYERGTPVNSKCLVQGACVKDLIEDLQTAMAMQEGSSKHQALKAYVLNA
jgi:hypothetical protein